MGKTEPTQENIVALGAHALTPLATLRRRYQRAVRSLPPADLVIYHQPWGTDLFGREDAGSKRVFWQHDPEAGNTAGVERLTRAVDAFWFDREPWRDALARSHSWIPSRRLRHLPLVFGAANDGGSMKTPEAPNSVEEPVIGWVGNLTIDLDRADRLEALWTALEANGFSGSLEICGDGPLEKRLRRRLEDASVSFFPRAAWHQRIGRWNGMVYLGNEPRWTLPVVESLRRGCCVWLPAEAETATDLPNPLCYPAGDMPTLAQKWSRAHGTGRAWALAAGEALFRAQSEKSTAFAVSEAVASVKSLRPREHRHRGLAGAWPFGFYRNIHRLLSGRR